MNDEQLKIIQLSTALGILNQLYTTRMNQLLGQHDLTIAQFGLLNHLLRLHDKEHTVSELTAALEINQPGVTKIVKKLKKLGQVEVKPSKADSRKKLIRLTDAGAREVQTILMSVGPDIMAWFAEWEPAEMEQFTEHLQKLGRWLDENRL